MKIIMALAQGFEKAGKVPYFDIRHFGESFDPGDKIRLSMARALSGRKAGKTCVGRLRFRDRAMMPEIVGGIVGGADNFDVEFLQNGVGGQTRPALRSRVPRSRARISHPATR
jgi:hypothetical protein